MNIKETQGAFFGAILTMHIRKLENAGIVRSERVHLKGAIHKVCSLKRIYRNQFPKKSEAS